MTEQYKDQNIKAIESTIKRDCKPYLKLIEDSWKYSALFRGGQAYKGIIKKKKGHLTSRRPKDTPLWLHEYVNNKLTEIAGWPVRNGVSTTTDPWQASSYGTVHLFFPIGKFEWAYMGDIAAKGRGIYDLYGELNRELRAKAQEIYELQKKKDIKSGAIPDRETRDKIIKAYHTWEQRGKEGEPPYSKQAYEEAISGQTHQSEYWWNLSNLNLSKWKESDLKMQSHDNTKELYGVIDEMLDTVQVNKPWHGIKGEVMMKVKEYYLVDWKEIPDADRNEFLGELGLYELD